MNVTTPGRRSFKVMRPLVARPEDGFPALLIGGANLMSFNGCSVFFGKLPGFGLVNEHRDFRQLKAMWNEANLVGIK